MMKNSVFAFCLLLAACSSSGQLKGFESRGASAGIVKLFDAETQLLARVLIEYGRFCSKGCVEQPKSVSCLARALTVRHENIERLCLSGLGGMKSGLTRGYLILPESRQSSFWPPAER